MSDYEIFLYVTWSLITWLLLLSWIPGYIAYRKGRQFGTWFIYGIFLWIIAFIHALFLVQDQGTLDDRKLATGKVQRCPYCKELVHYEATICKFCRSYLAPKEVPAP